MTYRKASLVVFVDVPVLGLVDVLGDARGRWLEPHTLHLLGADGHQDGWVGGHWLPTCRRKHT